MGVGFYTRDSVELESYEVDEELAKNVPILCVAYQNAHYFEIAFGAASSDEIGKPTKDLLEKIAMGRLEKSPNFENMREFDPITSVFTMGHSGKRLLSHNPKSLNDKMHEICSTASFTRVYQDQGRKVEGRSKFIDRVTVVRFSLHWENGTKFAIFGSSVWHYQDDLVNIELLQETADFRFFNCPNKVLLPESMSLSLDEFIRKAIRRYGCHAKHAKIIFLEKKVEDTNNDNVSEIREIKKPAPRTDDEILQRFKLRQPISHPDEWLLYLEALPFDVAKPHLRPNIDSKNWDDDRKSYSEIKKEAIKYLGFAWDKANDKRGLSAMRSIRHFIGWIWLLGEDNFDDLLDDYKYYGKPQLERISDYFNVSWKELDDGVRENF